ncbi:DUF4230 domain-containing protein [Haloimpatiens sp. FM7330]|uniref:DUF4230 domain-containing protein n=1 Tax=Haloimpatiens sp. FM7330 TaxID=3298610 RepID=UPI0036378515
MRNKSDFKMKLIIILIFISLGFGIYMGYKIFKAPKKQNKTWIVPNTNSSKKILTRDAVINSMKGKNELITLETKLKENITIDNSWGDLKIFKKIQNIHFYGTGVYCLDLSKITAKDISIDNVQKKLSINISKPYVKNITIAEKKTEYETVENGLLRFGEIKLEPSEYETILSEAKIKMLSKIKTLDIYNKAADASKKSVIDFLENIMKKTNTQKYKIEINFN